MKNLCIKTNFVLLLIFGWFFNIYFLSANEDVLPCSYCFWRSRSVKYDTSVLWPTFQMTLARSLMGVYFWYYFFNLLVSFFLILFRNFIYILYALMFYLHVCLCEGVGFWSYRQLWAASCGLGIEPRPPGRVVSAPNLWAISPDLLVTTF